jgi:hypothetical protein
VVRPGTLDRWWLPDATDADVAQPENH